MYIYRQTNSSFMITKLQSEIPMLKKHNIVWHSLALLLTFVVYIQFYKNISFMFIPAS